MRIKDTILNFVKNSEVYPVITGLASGCYALIFLYNTNYNLVSSWSQFLVFVLVFLIAPILFFKSFVFACSKIKAFEKHKHQLITIFNFTFFTFFMVLVTYGFSKKKIMLGLFILAIFLGFFLYKHLKKIIVLQLLLALVVAVQFMPKLYTALTYSDAWRELPDDIANVKFKKSPNIYVIQPDGYVNFNTLQNSVYNYNNTDFKTYLEEHQFQIYPNFRSNYYSTLSSNSAMFNMKHHYYNNDVNTFSEFYRGRDFIVGQNSVLDILKANNYKTHLLLEKPYLLSNRPKIAYDYCNIDISDIPFLTTGLNFKRELYKPLDSLLKSTKHQPHFYFIEKFDPSHISVYKESSKGREAERDVYLKRIEDTNIWLKKTIAMIEQHDDNALIVVVADHGGFVGFDYTLQSQKIQIKPELVTTVFSSMLAVKWSNKVSYFETNIKSNVNLFRMVFSNLSENNIYMDNLEKNESYIPINKDNKKEVFLCINENNKINYREN